MVNSSLGLLSWEKYSAARTSTSSWSASMYPKHIGGRGSADVFSVLFVKLPGMLVQINCTFLRILRGNHRLHIVRWVVFLQKSRILFVQLRNPVMYRWNMF